MMTLTRMTRPLFLGAALAMVLGNTSCIDAASDPDIVSVTVSPNTVPRSSTGMTDEFFTVTIVTSGFTSPPTGATVAIQELDPKLEAQPGATEINGDTITLQEIPKSWFGGLEEGTYNIETTVTSDLTDLTQSNTATVTVTAN